MSPQARSLLAPAIATLAGVMLLVALGVWQLHRLAWKEGLLAEIAARTHGAPVALPPKADWAHLQPRAYEYRKVRLTGRFENDKETLVFRGTEQGSGYLVVTPLVLADGGGTVLVNRGWVPDTLKAGATRAAGEPSGEVSLVGLMRAPEPRTIFTPPDDPRTGQFFTKDPVTIAAHDGLADVAPFIVDADATPNPGGWPLGGQTAIAIPNNHLSYALTWFALAATLVGVFASFAWSRLRRTSPATREARPLS